MGVIEMEKRPPVLDLLLQSFIRMLDVLDSCLGFWRITIKE